MDFWDAISQRHSIRKYAEDKDVPEDLVDRILGAAVQAPSAGNRQSWHFLVVRNERLKLALARAASQKFVGEAPVVIAVCAVPERSGARYGTRGTDLYTIQDTAAATEHILLAVTALGLGGCWVGAFDERAAATALDLPATLRPVALIPIGYPRQPSSRSTGRHSIAEISEQRP